MGALIDINMPIGDVTQLADIPTSRELTFVADQVNNAGRFPTAATGSLIASDR